MVAPTVEGIDLFKIAGRSISGWIPSLRTGTTSHVRQPFCNQLEERLLLWLEYHPKVSSYERSDIGTPFATTYRLPTPKNAPIAIGTGSPSGMLSARNGVLRFPSHDKRKTRTPKTDQRWAMEQTIWEVVGGESK